MISPPPPDYRLLVAQTPPAIYETAPDFWSDHIEWLSRSIGQSAFLEREQRFERLIQDVYKSELYKDGWDGYGAPKPNAASVDLGVRLVKILKFTELSPYSVLPSADGGIGISFRGRDGRRAMLEVLNDGSASYMIYGKGHPKSMGSFDISSPDLTPLFTRLLESL